MKWQLSSAHPREKLKDFDFLVVKPNLVSKLFRGVVAETDDTARQAAICGLTMLCYSVLSHHRQQGSRSSFLVAASSTPAAAATCDAQGIAMVRACLVMLLRCLRLNSRVVALTAMAMVRALVECSDALFDLNPTYPTLVLQVGAPLPLFLLFALPVHG